jgi:prevent-host-death family protein
MITEISTVKFRQNLGEIINQVQYQHDSVLIKKDGKPVAALVDARLFARIQRMEARFDVLSRCLEQGFAGVPQDEGLREIEEAVWQARAEK